MKTPESEISSAIYTLAVDLVKAVVKLPDSVAVEHSIHGNLDAFAVRVDQGDVRRVIGSRGKHFKALQHVVVSACKALGREGFFAVKEDAVVRPAPNLERVFPLDRGRPFAPVRGLLERVVGVFVTNPKDFSIEDKDFGSGHLFEIKVNSVAYSQIMGETIVFDYGPDGSNIGMIKNLFDAIGKNHGKLVKIVLTKTG